MPVCVGVDWKTLKPASNKILGFSGSLPTASLAVKLGTWVPLKVVRQFGCDPPWWLGRSSARSASSSSSASCALVFSEQWLWINPTCWAKSVIISFRDLTQVLGLRYCWITDKRHDGSIVFAYLLLDASSIATTHWLFGEATVKTSRNTFSSVFQTPFYLFRFVVLEGMKACFRRRYSPPDGLRFLINHEEAKTDKTFSHLFDSWERMMCARCLMKLQSWGMDKRLKPAEKTSWKYRCLQSPCWTDAHPSVMILY